MVPSKISNPDRSSAGFVREVWCDDETVSKLFAELVKLEVRVDTGRTLSDYADIRSTWRR